MYQPLTIADEEGVILLDGEVVHLLRMLNQDDTLDRPVAAIGLADTLAEAQIGSIDPAAILGYSSTT